ncbi:MAG: hypothetical protein B6I38_11205 [Anaerolineaceae bacterium 4572_5.1]|nr:MAG: hypothetical protein B6I38_11205 [Anaerolineaceae bacterium 4572_5.1]
MLDAFFDPKSVAVIGASADPGKLGYAVLENLVKGGYAQKGEIYPINRKADEILGYKAYASVNDVPHDIDLAVIVIPYLYVPAVLRECGKKSIPAVVVITAGFRESGVDGLERERELIEIANTNGMRLVGPNCLGVIDTFTPLNASFSAGTPPQGPMAFMSQSGTTEAGSRAVSSHTGSLAGSEQAYKAAFQQAGVLRADSMSGMFDMALALGYQPPLEGDRIAIITNAGGPGILVTDALEQKNITLARLKIKTRQTLENYLPEAASVANPVDVLGDAKADRYQVAIDTVVKDPNVDGLIIVLTPQAMTEIPATAEAIGKLSQKTDKPILACFMGEAEVEAGVKVLRKYGVPNYPFPEGAALAIRAMSDYREIRKLPEPEYVHYDIDKEATQKVLDKAASEDRYAIGDAEAWDILKSYGLRVPNSQLAKTADEAVKFASEIGYPVVLKIASPDILHKTDVGGVKVGLRNAEEVRDAFDLMLYRTKRFIPNARIWGCQVQEMVPPGGTEVLIGMNRDPQFGPLVTFGLGGIYVEVLKDVTFRIAPFSRREAEEMLSEIRTKALLDGVRGNPPVDKKALIDIILRMGQLVQDFPEIVEFDINPLIVYPEGQGAVAIDMRLVFTKND